MPSIDGGSQTSLDYAPHMYILREGGNPSREEDHYFVGNATAYFTDTDSQKYHIGITRETHEPMLVADVWSPKLNKQQAVPAEAVPKQALAALAQEGLREIGSRAGADILAACGIKIPKHLRLIDWNLLFNGSAEEKAGQQELKEVWGQIGKTIRPALEESTKIR